jgi:phage terminase small subunit
VAKLTEKQKRFADYFIESGNAEESARRAGYSEAYARGNAHKLVANSCIKQYIDERIAGKDSERIAKQDEVLEFLTRVLRGDEQEEIPLGDGGGVQRLVHKELDAKDRIKAAELLGKRYGIWTDSMKIAAEVAVQIVDDVSD